MISKMGNLVDEGVGGGDTGLKVRVRKTEKRLRDGFNCNDNLRI